ncbi:MAG: LuxR C-terminal-related transcriptional regulator [Chitinophagaceae bacterium]
MEQSFDFQQVFFNYLNEFAFDESKLNYHLVEQHKTALQTISAIGNSGTGIFDVAQKKVLFYSSNFGKLLGYQPDDYQNIGQEFFAAKIHPEDAITCSLNGIAILKVLNKFSAEEKLQHKMVTEYRMLNAQGKYVRLIEQYQVLELDADGKIWLMFNIVDIAPNQEELDQCRSKLLNFKTGEIVLLDLPTKMQFELTNREIEILRLVKQGFLSKEISYKLSISVNTVNTHRQRFLEKLGANNSIEAVTFATKFGLLN